MTESKSIEDTTVVTPGRKMWLHSGGKTFFGFPGDHIDDPNVSVMVPVKDFESMARIYDEESLTRSGLSPGQVAKSMAGWCLPRSSIGRVDGWDKKIR